MEFATWIILKQGYSTLCETCWNEPAHTCEFSEEGTFVKGILHECEKANAGCAAGGCLCVEFRKKCKKSGMAYASRSCSMSKTINVRLNQSLSLGAVKDHSESIPKQARIYIVHFNQKCNCKKEGLTGMQARW